MRSRATPRGSMAVSEASSDDEDAESPGERKSNSEEDLIQNELNRAVGSNGATIAKEAPLKP